MSAIVTKEGFDYAFDVRACSTCKGRCCTGESGYIYVSKNNSPFAIKQSDGSEIDRNYVQISYTIDY